MASDLNRDYPNILAVAGVHPHNAKKFHPEAAEALKQLADDKKYVLSEKSDSTSTTIFHRPNSKSKFSEISSILPRIWVSLL